jgi:hypothetical protein
MEYSDGQQESLRLAEGSTAWQRTGDVERDLALGAGVGFLLAQLMHFDIGLGLVVGALAGLAAARLWPKGTAGS